MQGVLRLVQLLTMAVWVGGLVFFAFILAPVAFATLPSVHIAGLIVGGTLRVFHVVGLWCGGLFCAATALIFRGARVRTRGRYEMEFLLAAVMLVATAYLQWNVLPAMELDRAHAGGVIESAAVDNPARVHFDKLHVRSERVEGSVLFVGLGVLWLMSREGLPAPTATNGSAPGV
jgi:uncharacterized membrane protein